MTVRNLTLAEVVAQEKQKRSASARAAAVHELLLAAKEAAVVIGQLCDEMSQDKKRAPVIQRLIAAIKAAEGR